MAYDSRALSREAAQYNAQEIEAEAELRQLEASLKAIRAKADEARFQKQKSEAAREEAFQKERGERQTAVRESITDHHVEAMRKAIKHEDQHLIDCLKVVAAGDMETNPDATTFVGAMVLRELVGHDDEFLTEIAVKVLADPMFITTNGVQQSQGYNTHPKHHFSPNLASAPPSPTKPHYIDPHSPQVPPISPRLSTYGRDESPQLGSEGNGVAGGPSDSHEDGLLLTEVAGGEAVETPKPSEEQEAAEDNNGDFDEDKSGQQEVPADNSLGNTELNNGNGVATAWVHDNSIEAEKSPVTMAGIEYSTEREDATEAVDRPEVLDQEPSAFITELASHAKLKRHSRESDYSYESDTASANIAGVYVAIPKREKEGDLDSTLPQTPQLATPIPKKSHAGLLAQGKTTPGSKRSSGKRKRLESEVTTSGAGDNNEMTTTPTKKAKTKAKDESSVPKRIMDFVKKVKAMTSTSQYEELSCSICDTSPKGPRLSHCLHMYCEACWKDTAKQSGKTKVTEQPCMRDGCEGVLGKAVIVPSRLNLSDMNSEIWTGQKARSSIPMVEDEPEASEELENSIDVH